jgi:hypothetical protein
LFCFITKAFNLLISDSKKIQFYNLFYELGVN